MTFEATGMDKYTMIMLICDDKYEDFLHLVDDLIKEQLPQMEIYDEYLAKSDDDKKAVRFQAILDLVESAMVDKYESNQSKYSHLSEEARTEAVFLDVRKQNLAIYGRSEPPASATPEPPLATPQTNNEFSLWRFLFNIIKSLFGF